MTQSPRTKFQTLRSLPSCGICFIEIKLRFLKFLSQSGSHLQIMELLKYFFSPVLTRNNNNNNNNNNKTTTTTRQKHYVQIKGPLQRGRSFVRDSIHASRNSKRSSFQTQGSSLEFRASSVNLLLSGTVLASTLNFQIIGSH